MRNWHNTSEKLPFELSNKNQKKRNENPNGAHTVDCCDDVTGSC